MNKFAIIAAIALSGVSSYAQGVINGFNAFKPTGSLVNAIVNDVVNDVGVTSALLAAVGRVEVLALDGTVLSSVKDGSGNALVAPGIFSLGTMTIPGSTVGQPASVLLRAWDSSTGSTYANALESASITVTFPTVGGATAPSNFVLASNFTGLTLQIIPEPSTMALAAIGVAGLFFVARRKN